MSLTPDAVSRRAAHAVEVVRPRLRGVTHLAMAPIAAVMAGPSASGNHERSPAARSGPHIEQYGVCFGTQGIRQTVNGQSVSQAMHCSPCVAAPRRALVLLCLTTPFTVAFASTRGAARSNWRRKKTVVHVEPPVVPTRKAIGAYAAPVAKPQSNSVQIASPRTFDCYSIKLSTCNNDEPTCQKQCNAHPDCDWCRGMEGQLG